MALLSKNKNLTTSYQTIHTGTAGNQTAAHTISLTNNTASQVTFDLTFYSAADAATYQLATLQPIGAYKTYTWPKPINMAAGDFIQAKASANSAVVTNISYYESSTTVSGFTLRGVWSSAVAYSINDIVFYNGVSYAALQAGTNQTPNTATTYWQVFSSLGYTGSQGVIGFTGSVGFVGSQGVGFTGSQGVIGFTGSKGDIGFTGSKGDIGFTGSRGAFDAIGFTGSKGDIGFTGSVGFVGSQGVIGFTGSQGDIGFTGSQGVIGFTGSVGFVGSQGFTGSQGNIGFTGSQGVIGFTGSVGFVGSQGYTGSQGAVVYTSSSTPPVSPVVSQIWIDSNTGIQYFYYDDGNTSQWIELGNSGPRGFTGSQGNIGFTGSQGVGFTGSQGVIGFTGSVGFTGSQGVGFTGSQGVIGFTGSQGDVGFTGSQGVGFTGSQGVIGFTGSQGDVGFTGSQGVIGFTGSQGVIGFTGSQGVIGFTGSIGFVGSQGVIGFTGSVGFTGSQGVGFTGSQGVIGFTGSQGVIGFTGSAANILNGVINFSEVVTPLTGATGVVVHNFALSEVFYHTSPASNFTANFTNVPTTSNAAIGIAILVAQGATPYLPNAVQIDGSAQTILWQGGSAASANANKTDVFVFNLIRLTSSWVVLGSGTTHG